MHVLRSLGSLIYMCMCGCVADFIYEYVQWLLIIYSPNKAVLYFKDINTKKMC